MRMIRGLAPVLEAHHKVSVLDEALSAAARLSHRYIPSRQLPDKAVTLIDTACARVAISQHSVPPRVEDRRRKIEGLEAELRILNREATVGIEHAERRLEDREGVRGGEKGLCQPRSRVEVKSAISFHKSSNLRKELRFVARVMCNQTATLE